MIPLIVDNAIAQRLGFTRAAIATEVRRGTWILLARGVYQTRTLNADEHPVDALFPAKLVQCRRSILSHRSALVAHRLDDWTYYRNQIQSIEDVEVIVEKHTSCRIPRAYERRDTALANTASIGELLVTDRAQTLIDLADVLCIDALEIVLESALRGTNAWEPQVWDTLLLARLRTYVATAPYVAASLRGVLQRRPLNARPTGSAAETQAVQVIRNAGLPALDRQPTIRICDRRGRVLRTLYPDLGELNRGLLVEIDGIDAHSGAEALARDLKRQNQLVRTFEILRFTGTQVRQNPNQLVVMVQSALNRLPENRLESQPNVRKTADGLDILMS
jgi:hypothetical protein